MTTSVEQVVDGIKYQVEIVHDENMSNPLDREHDESKMGTIIGSHRRYNFFDQAHNTEKYSSWDEWAKRSFGKDCIYLPVYMLDHSGISINTTGFSCDWDSGQLGFVYVNKERVRELYDVKRITKKVMERAEEELRAEIEMVNVYLQGECFGYRLFKDNKEVDSCWGFLAYPDRKTVIDYMAEDWDVEFKPLIDKLKVVF